MDQIDVCPLPSTLVLKRHPRSRAASQSPSFSTLGRLAVASGIDGALLELHINSTHAGRNVPHFITIVEQIFRRARLSGSSSSLPRNMNDRGIFLTDWSHRPF
jgi:hypothetical protein